MHPLTNKVCTNWFSREKPSVHTKRRPSFRAWTQEPKINKMKWTSNAWYLFAKLLLPKSSSLSSEAWHQTPTRCLLSFASSFTVYFLWCDNNFQHKQIHIRVVVVSYDKTTFTSLIICCDCPDIRNLELCSTKWHSRCCGQSDRSTCQAQMEIGAVIVHEVVAFLLELFPSIVRHLYLVLLRVVSCSLISWFTLEISLNFLV